ncbi:hypothetical protein [Pseudomonas sp. CFBP 13727]|uniref:hypothetical protein n=1 Tax=Pseudomonas sp. CFBP 13727 TaxID=2775295 RepID=UPI00177D70FE|nr:hypothetical protein [Pseudomonas sp. CFBP 13727]MBD8621690.1 hypothetical protein [Pseudomonas sp. CFBP 13727]
MSNQSRIEFEAWAATKGMAMHLARAESGLYVSRVTQNYMDCWLESQAGPAAEVQALRDALSSARPYVAFAFSEGMDGSHEAGLQLDAALAKDASN